MESISPSDLGTPRFLPNTPVFAPTQTSGIVGVSTSRNSYPPESVSYPLNAQQPNFSSPMPQDFHSNTAEFMPQSSPNTLICHWANCQATYSTLSDLVGHVNLEHLRLPVTATDVQTNEQPQSFGFSADSAGLNFIITQAVYPETNSEFSYPSCQWRDCHVYPPAKYTPGRSDHEPTEALDFLASHLLQDHLGLSPGLFPFADPTPANQFQEQQKYSYPDNKLAGVCRGESTASPLSPPFTPSSERAITASSYIAYPEPPNHSADAVSAWTSPSPPSGPPASMSPALSEPALHTCEGTHRCLWQGCEMAFSSGEELTAHLTDIHVGGGKAQYECFWAECGRNGESGFGSKQKICRHLQVCQLYQCSNSARFTPCKLLPVVPHGSPTVSVRPMSTKFLGGCDLAATYAETHARKYV